MILSKFQDKNGRIATSKMKEDVKLKSDFENRLIDILFNYDYDPKFGGVIETYRNLCYIPRNGILFIDSQNEVIGYIEICFECQREEIKVDSNHIGGFCNKKFAMLKDLFKDSGIKVWTCSIGFQLATGVNTVYTALR